MQIGHVYKQLRHKKEEIFKLTHGLDLMGLYFPMSNPVAVKRTEFFFMLMLVLMLMFSCGWGIPNSEDHIAHLLELLWRAV